MSIYKNIPLLFIFLLLSPNSLVAEQPASFSKAKRILSQLYADHQITFYCECLYKKVEGKLRTDLDSCNYTPRKSARRAARIEWEHIVPAWWIGHQRQCWQNGGRKNCRKTDEIFRKAEANMYNLVPSVGEINGDRSNYRFGVIEGEERKYGQCNFEVNFKQRVAEPNDQIRGDIARTYFYMSDTYNIRLSKQQKKLFDAWNKLDPVDEWELERTNRITMITGTPNRYVQMPSEAPSD